jgi:RNA polymerase sigma-70 factor (ECF subfamily)
MPELYKAKDALAQASKENADRSKTDARHNQSYLHIWTPVWNSLQFGSECYRRKGGKTEMERVIHVTQVSSLAGRAARELDDMVTLCVTYRARIYRYALFSLRNPDLAASLTQDCLLRAYAGRNNFRGDCSVSTWLIRIAANLIRDYTRSQKFQFWKKVSITAVDPSTIVDRLRSPERSPEAALILKEEVEQLRDSFDTLSARQRSVLLLRFVDEMELSEIAAALGLRIATVKCHLHRAIQTVRRTTQRRK